MKYTRALLRSTHGPAMSKRHRRGNGEQARTGARTSAEERRAAHQMMMGGHGGPGMGGPVMGGPGMGRMGDDDMPGMPH